MERACKAELSAITIGIAVPASSRTAGTVALILVLAKTVMLLGGLLFAARSIIISTDAIDYEVQRTLSLGRSVLIKALADRLAS